VAARGDTPRRQQDVQTGARSKIEHDLARLKVRQQGRVAAAEAGARGDTDARELRGRIALATASIAAAVAAAIVAARRGRTLGHVQRALGVFRPHGLLRTDDVNLVPSSYVVHRSSSE
jgi:hypothetical protein